MRERIRSAEQMRTHRRSIAEKVTADFLYLHPDWLTRYGESARIRGIEDAIYHQDFLAASIETGDVRAFSEYLQWTAGVLEARGMASHFLRENVQQIAAEMQGRLDPTVGQEVREFVDAALDAMSTPAEVPGETGHTTPLSSVQALYLQAILHGQRQSAAGLALETVRQGHPVVDLYCDVIEASMREIGHLWETNRISVAQEHMATAITQFVLASVYPMVRPAQPPRGKVLITGVEGEQHQVGPNIVADALEAEGWDVRFLGTNTPMAGVLQALQEHGSDVLGISATMLFNIPAVRRLIAAVRSLPGRRLHIILGGSAFRVAPALGLELGAEGVALDVREALRLAATL